MGVIKDAVSHIQKIRKSSVAIGNSGLLSGKTTAIMKTAQ